MKTLTEVEPRIAIPAGAAYIITAPGSYYLTGNMTIASGDAITVNASDVCIDLNGFTITGTATGNASSSGINITNQTNVRVKNGAIVKMAYGVRLGGDVQSMVGQRFENINFSGCTLFGVYFGAYSSGSVVKGCSFNRIGAGTGRAIVSAVFALGGVRVEDCHVDIVTGTAGSVAYGFYLSVDDFAVGNSISNCATGIYNGKYRDNLFLSCPVTVKNGVDAGGNN